MSAASVRHVLLDADGVLQRFPPGHDRVLTSRLGERTRAFLHEAWDAELPALRGERAWLPDLARVMARHGLDEPVASFYAEVWLASRMDPRSRALVHRLRAAGYGVHLGTNQTRERALFMGTALGFDDLFDVSVYSWAVGAKKPEPAYFEAALGLLGVPAEQVLFVDDRDDNVETARAAGLAGVVWHLDEGHDVLEQRLADHGVVPGGRVRG